MENMIASLVGRYDIGKLTRRDLIKGLTILAATGTSASAAGLTGVKLDHLGIAVSNMQRSRDYYVNVFGLVENTNPRANNSLRVDFPDGGFLTLQESNIGGQVDHLAIKLENFDKAMVSAQLMDNGITPIDLPASASGGAGFHIIDPDGLKVQIR